MEWTYNFYNNILNINLILNLIFNVKKYQNASETTPKN